MVSESHNHAADLKSIHKIMDSPYRDEIQRQLCTRAGDAIVFNTILWVNLATFQCVVLAHFGLGLEPALIYTLIAYGLIIGNGVLQFISYKRHPLSANLHWYNSVIEDAAIWLILPVNAWASNAASPVIALSTSFTVLFVLALTSVKTYREFVISKAIFLMAVFGYAIFWGDSTSASTQVVFPLTVTSVLLFAVAYWHYIRQVKFFHLMSSEQDLRLALNDRNRQLINAHQLRDRIIRHIGHDLRQPINSVSYALFNLKRVLPENTQSEQVDLASRALESANSLIEDIVQISSYKKQGTLEPSRERLKLGPLLEMLVREFSFTADQAGRQLKLVTCSAWVESDPAMISRIMRNFISNAVRHAPGARIVIGVRRRPGALELQVCDNGPGMPPELVNNAFEEFTQGQSERMEGFGLGLNIAKNLAAAVGAQVALKSRLGKGTVCSLTLALACRAEAPLKQ